MSDLDCQLRKASQQNQQVRDLCHYLMKITNPDEIVHKQLGTNLMLKQCFCNALAWGLRIYAYITHYPSLS